MDPKRFAGKHGVAVTLYDHLVLTAAEQHETSYLMPGGRWERMVEDLSQRYGWAADTVDQVLRLLVREGFIENRRSRICFPEFAELIVTEWPTARYMREKARKEKEGGSRGKYTGDVKAGKTALPSAEDVPEAAVRSRQMQKTVQKVMQSSGSAPSSVRKAAAGSQEQLPARRSFGRRSSA